MQPVHGRVLVVDDHENNRDLLSQRLRRQGHTTALAEHGAQALELLRSQPFDLVLLDIMMPGMDGYQVLEAIKVDPDLRHLPVMQHAIGQFRRENGRPFQIRIGIHSGPVVAGVIGTRKFIYDLWGDTVNTASRMESNSLPGAIQVSAPCYELLKHDYRFEPRGRIQVKGKGVMSTYFLKDRLAFSVNC